jgi:nucleoprotein TPR
LILNKYRSKDLSAQNALLHQYLETVSTQATRIPQADDFSAMEGTSGDADVSGNVDTKVSDLSKQENIRFKAQVEHLTQSLQETRATLAEVCSLVFNTVDHK